MTGRRWHPFDIVTRVFAERLRGNEPSDQLCAMVRSQDIDWERVVGHASAQFVLPAFAAALQDLGLVASLEEEIGAFLAAVLAANVERNCEIGDELVAAVGILNRAGIEPVLLKGAIRLVDGTYPDHGWRMLRDVDLLVPEAQWADAILALQRDGYAIVRDKGDHYEARLRRRGGFVGVEVHRELFSTRLGHLLRGIEVLHCAQTTSFANVTMGLPSINHQIVHLIGHGQITDRNYAYGRISFRDRLEAVALMHWGRQKVDWQDVFAHFVAAGYRRPLLAFLLSLQDSGLCAAPKLGRTDLLTGLQRRRIALQARNNTMAHISLWVGWSFNQIRRHVTGRDAGRLRVARTVKRLISERGAARRMARQFVDLAPRPW